METKIICGRKHWKRRCDKCKGLCWTQQKVGSYVCRTCVDYKFTGSNLGVTRGDLAVAGSEKRYNG